MYSFDKSIRWCFFSADCPSSCTLDYDPVCASSSNNPSTKTTFSNICMIRKYNCEHGERYYMLYKGPCFDGRSFILSFVFLKIFSSLIVMKKNLSEHLNFDCNFTIIQNGKRHSQIKIVYWNYISIFTAKLKTTCN